MQKLYNGSKTLHRIKGNYMKSESRNLKKQILKKIDSQKKNIIKLCSDIVKIPSENPPGDTTKLVSFLKEYLESEGFSTKTYEPKKNNPNLVSLVGSAQGPHFVFNGHLDEFPAEVGQPWRVPPFGGVVRGNKLYGRGVADMKAGLTASVAAFRLLSEVESQLQGKMSLQLVSDEETGGKWGTKWLLENEPSLRGSACIIGEPTSLQVSTGMKGKVYMSLIAQGKAGHGSTAQFAGENAIVKTARAIPVILSMGRIKGKSIPEARKMLRNAMQLLNRRKRGSGRALEYVTVNVGVIRGGAKANIIPAKCEVEVDMRLPFGITSDMIESTLQERLLKAGIDMGFQWFDTPLVEANYTPDNHPFVLNVKSNATTTTGMNTITILGTGRNDSCYYRAHGVPVAVYGPRPFNVAAPDEYVLIADLIAAAKVHAAVAVDHLA